jgi:hypothetical protein
MEYDHKLMELLVDYLNLIDVVELGEETLLQ